MSPLGPKKKGIRFNLYWMYSLIALVLIGLYYMNDNTMSKEVNWTEFEKIAKEGGITRLTVFAKKDYAEAQLNDSTAKAVFKTDKINGKPVIYTNIPSGDSFAKTLDTWKKEDGFNAEVYYENSSDLTNILWSVGPFILLIVFWIYLARRMTNQGGGGSGGVFNVGKAKAQLFDKDGAVKVTFNDVAGLSEAKQEVEEIVEFLKNPNRYTDLGGKIPKGALLVGPPGTGKTLLAKAVAGEANVPFFSLSGSDFVEMFVGVGASRVRDLFRQAKEKAPCIVFIDEIDAVGRARGKNPNMGSNDERENTLNQLLTEMDGFGSNSGVIILAATNRNPCLLIQGGMPMHRNKIDMPRTKRLTRRAFALYAALVLVCCAATPVLAEGDPLTVVNNLSTFIFSIIRAIGLILLGWGIVQVGLSLQSHDPSQRSRGFLTLAGGIIITFAKEILDLIVGTGV